jgi:hypothetical protein
VICYFSGFPGNAWMMDPYIGFDLYFLEVIAVFYLFRVFGYFLLLVLHPGVSVVFQNHSKHLVSMYTLPHEEKNHVNSRFVSQELPVNDGPEVGCQFLKHFLDCVSEFFFSSLGMSVML